MAFASALHASVPPILINDSMDPEAINVVLITHYPSALRTLTLIKLTSMTKLLRYSSNQI